MVKGSNKNFDRGRGESRMIGCFPPILLVDFTIDDDDILKRIFKKFLKEIKTGLNRTSIFQLFIFILCTQ